jgi:hypothetical protein
MARHALGILGVIAASILLAVSAAMNYRFGFSLGKTALDGEIYGAASVAADCFKALVPFFFFAAIRNRMWAQALAAVLVWVVVTGYAMTSALGHAALNRLDTSGQRAAAAANYTDLRADSKRAQEQLSWIPAHRPYETVAAEVNVHKAQRYWAVTNECTDVRGRGARNYCQQYFKLNAELASAQNSQKLESRIAEIGAKLANVTGSAVMAQADPQASVLAKITGLDVPTVQTGLTMFVALLIEIGSGFGMFVAFAYWRIHDPVTPRVRSPLRAQASVADVMVAEEATAQAVAATPPPVRSLNANDNRMPHGVPDSDVQRFYRERVVAAPDSSSVTSTELYEEYCAWCEETDKVPFAHPRVTREIGELGVKKERIGKRTRYFGIALRSASEQGAVKKLPAPVPQAA